jgi:hypothetical protein
MGQERRCSRVPHTSLLAQVSHVLCNHLLQEGETWPET